MAVISARDTEVHVSTTEAGTYTCIGKILTVSRREEGADDEEVYVLCDSAAIVEAGNDEATLELTMLWDLADTTGQSVLRTARRDGTTVFIRTLWDGTLGEQQEFQVLAINIDADPNGTGVNRFVRGSMTLRSAGDLTLITA